MTERLANTHTLEPARRIGDRLGSGEIKKMDKAGQGRGAHGSQDQGFIGNRDLIEWINSTLCPQDKWYRK